MNRELAVGEERLTVVGSDDLEQHGRSPSLGQLALPHHELRHLLIVQLPGSKRPHDSHVTVM